MTRFRYAAEDDRGVVRDGLLDAGCHEDALRLLRAERLRPLTLSLDRANPWAQLGLAASDDKSLTLSELAQITRRISDLLKAGLPAAQALRLAAGQARGPREGAFLSSLYERVRAGAPLSEAVTRSDFATPKLVRALIAAGEELGALGEQFSRLAVHYEERVKLRREMLAQLAYPAALLALILATLIFLSFLVLPEFEAIFSTADADPPPETEFVLQAGRLVRDYWALIPIIAVGAFLLAAHLAKTNAQFLQNGLLHLPVVGSIAAMSDHGRYFRTLSTLLEGGMPLARAMPLANASVRFLRIRTELEGAEIAVRSGARLGTSLARVSSLSPALTSFIVIGDETGALGSMSAQAANYAETYVANATRRAMALLAPALTALAGLMTAGVIAAVMTGVLSLNETIY